MAVRVKDRIEGNIRQSDKVNNSLSIQLNSGTATVYDGSAAKSINITPAAINAATAGHTHNYIISSGTMTMISGTAKWASGFTVGNIYSSGYPFSYGTTWMYQGTFGAELIFDGVGGDAGAGTGHMYFRTRSDWATSTWGDWKHLLDSSNYTTYTVTKTGTGASGTWGINISGNAATSTKANQLGEYETAGEYTKHTLAYFNASLANNGTAQKGVNDSPSTTATWWHFLRFTHSNSAGYYTDLAIPFNVNSLYYKRIAGGSVANSTTNAGWVKVLDELNYTDHTVTKTGTGASGTWGISITGSSASCTGNAATATKANQLTTARTISLGGQFRGSASFNGTSNITISGNLQYASINGGNTNSYPYRRFAYGTPGTGQYVDHYGVFLITKNCENNLFGIVKISHRTNSTGTSCSCSAVWLVRSGIPEDAITIASWGASGSNNVYFDVYYKADAAWPRTTITALGPCNMTLCDTSEAENAASTTYAYASVAAGGSALHGQGYTIINSSVQTPIYGAVWN